jgi:hypothetical protein
MVKTKRTALIKGTGDTNSPNIPRANQVSRQDHVQEAIPLVNRPQRHGANTYETFYRQQQIEGLREISADMSRQIESLNNRINAIPENGRFPLVNLARRTYRRRLQANTSDLQRQMGAIERSIEQLENPTINIPTAHAVISPPIAETHHREEETTQQEGTGTKTKLKKQNRWITHVSTYAKTHGISYKQALKSADAKTTYKNQ